jgi:sec-independent protein translocase protein TatC
MAPLVVLYEISLILGRIFQPTGEPRFGFLADDDEEDEETPDDDASADLVAGGDSRTPNELD